MSAVHRRAVLAGAPTSVASPRWLDHRKRRVSMVTTRERVLAAAKRAGASAVVFKYPGAAGHERCRDICLIYR